MISRLPKWVWAGGALLATLAGMINTIGFLSFAHQGISSYGNSFALRRADGRSRIFLTFHPLFLIAAFVGGAFLGGFIIRDSTLTWGRRYGVALFVESLLLCAAVPLLNRHQYIGAYFCSAACGLQNALAGTFSGAIIRTSHVTGLFTDIGVLLGHLLAGVKIDFRRLKLYSILVTSFLMGSFFGACLFPHWGYRTLFLPAAITGMSGVLYRLFRRKLSLIS